MIGIQEFYNGRSIFITGATGFMGKVLVEKLLRSCPEISRLYLLIRPSPDKNVNIRLDELIKCEVFEWLKQNRPDALKKLTAIKGDVSLPNLGISTTDMEELIEKVSVIFHSAARVRFDDDLRASLEMNVKGPKRVSNFSRQLRHLKALVHVSTAFNNLDKTEIKEEVYPSSLDPQKLLDLIDTMDDNLLASITKKLTGKCPNVYAYTKALGEHLLQTECQLHDIPLVIVRPSIVTAAMKEPVPGWIDNWNGPSGIVAGVSKGLIRTVRVNEQLVTDMIPVDIPINMMIAAAWNKATNSSKEQILVYNCSTGSLNPLTWKDFERVSLHHVRELPSKEMMWYPSIVLTPNWLAFQIELVLYHYLPAYFFDTIASLCGKKPFLVRLYKKANKIMKCLEFYTLNEWNFVSRNPGKLTENMSAEDKETFNVDVKKIEWESYLQSYVSGVRKYLLKEDPKTLVAAKRNLQKMKWLRTTVRLVFIGLLLFFFYLITYTSTGMVRKNSFEIILEQSASFI